MNESQGLNELRDLALRIAHEHGFQDATVGEEIALMHSELSEALEDYRAGKKPNEVWYTDALKDVHEHPYPETRKGEGDRAHPYKPCGIPSEMADVMIRVLHFSGKHGIDIETAVREKMAYNETRPFKHGKKL